jgi:hypothetical protein
VPIPVAARSRAWVCSRSLARIVGSNPAEGMEVCLLRGLRVGSYKRFLSWAVHSSRGVLPSVVCLSVIVKPRKRGGPGPIGAVAPWKNIIIIVSGSSSSMVVVIVVVSRDSVVGIAARLRAGRYGVRIPAEAKDFSILRIGHNGSGADPASYSVGTGFFSGGKLVRA